MSLPDKLLQPTEYFAEIETRYMSLLGAITKGRQMQTATSVMIQLDAEQTAKYYTEILKDNQLKSDRIEALEKLLEVYRRLRTKLLVDIDDNIMIEKAEQEYSNHLKENQNET